MTRLLTGLLVGGLAGIAATLLLQRLTAPSGSHSEADKPRIGPVVAGQRNPSRTAIEERSREPALAPVPAAGKSAKHATEPLAGIPITSGFEQVLIRPPAPAPTLYPTADLHARLAAEGRDSAWADSAEEEIRTSVDGYLDQYGMDRHRIELPEVHCGVSLCEIQAQGFAGDLNGSASDFQRAMSELMRGVLAQDFSANDFVLSVFTLPSGQVGYATFLTRKTHN